MSPVVKDIISLVQSLVVLAIALGGVLWALFRRTDGKSAEDATRDATRGAVIGTMEKKLEEVLAEIKGTRAELRALSERGVLHEVRLTTLEGQMKKLDGEYGTLQERCLQCSRDILVAITKKPSES